MALAKLNIVIGASIKELQDAMKGAQKSIAETGKRMEDMGKTLSKRVTAPLVALGALSVRAFGQQEKAELRLRAALQANGRQVDQLFGKYNSFAQEMQRTTVVGDEVTLAMLAQAESLGITGDSAERAVKNSIAMQSAFGVNAQSALRYTAALEEGNATMLTRYLPALRDIEDESERAAVAQDMLAKAFSSAEAEAQGAAGQMVQMKNAIGDAMEDIGGVIATAIMPFIARIKEMAEAFQALDKDVLRNIVVIGALVAAIIPALVIMGKLLQSITLVTGAVRALTVAMMANPWIAAAVAVAGLTTVVVRSNRKLLQQRDLITEVLSMDESGTSDEMDKVTNATNEARRQLEFANKKVQIFGMDGSEAFDKVSKAIDASREQIARANRQIQTYGIEGTEAAEKIIEPLERQHQQLIEMRQEIRGLIRDMSLVDVLPELGTGALLKVKENFADLNTELEETEAVMKRISDTAFMEDFAADDASVDLDIDTSPAEGSIAHYEQILRGINEQIRQTNDETWRQAQMAQAESVEAQIAALYDLKRANEEVMHSVGPVGTMIAALRELKRVNEEVAESAKIMGSALQTVVSTALTDFATTIGEAFTGDAGASGFFNNLLMIVADFGEQLGKALIAAGVAALRFKTLLANPVAAIAAGVALVATSRVVKNLLESGPSVSVNDAMITSSGKVVKFHPDDNILAMKDFSGIGGGGGTVRIEPFVLPGGDILFSQERTITSQTRTGRR